MVSYRLCAFVFNSTSEDESSPPKATSTSVAANSVAEPKTPAAGVGTEVRAQKPVPEEAEKKASPQPAAADEEEAAPESAEVAEARALVEAWAEAQTNLDFSVYSKMYDAKFQGIKRTKSGTATAYERRKWLKDRKKMFKPGQTVHVRNIRIELGKTPGMAFVSFRQFWKSAKYADQGVKDRLPFLRIAIHS